MRRAIVTGASKGIGRAIAETLAAKSYRVLAVARNGDALDALAEHAGGAIRPYAADLRSPEKARQAVAAAIEDFGGLDLLVNCAGATKRGDFLSLSHEDFLDGFALKFFGAVALTRAAWPHLIASKSGHVVNIIGAGGRTPDPEFTIGGPVNSALMNFTKAMAERGRLEGVRVNAVNPGLTETDRLKTRIEALVSETGLSEAQARRTMLAEQKICRFGQPGEIAALVQFLDSAAGANMHGAIVDCDAGMTKGL